MWQFLRFAARATAGGARPCGREEPRLTGYNGDACGREPSQITPMLDLTKRSDFLITAVLFESSLIGIALGLGWCFGADPIARLTFDVLPALWGLAGTVPMLALFHVANRYPLGPLRR